MTFCITFLLDPQTTSAVRAMWQALEAAGQPNLMLSLDYPPHVTAMAAKEADMGGLRLALKAFCKQTSPLTVNFYALGVFPSEFGVVFLTPCANHALLDLHAALWRSASAFVSQPSDIYRPGIWTPHITLAYNLPPDKLGQAAGLLAGIPWPRSGLIDGVLFGDFRVEGGSTLEEIRFG